MKKIYAFIGLPCSGKTQAARFISSHINGTYISTGDISRRLMTTEEERNLTAAADQYPGEDALRMELTKQIEKAPESPIIIDGFPRFPEQAQFMIEEYYYYSPIVIEINAGDERTLLTRAHFRHRDTQDNLEQFTGRIRAASSNLTGIYKVLQEQFIPFYTIMSTSEDIMLTQFKRITKIK